MAKRDRDLDADFDPAPSPRGPEEPPSAAPMDAADAPALLSRPAIEEVVGRWFSDCIKGGPIGRHTESYNHLHGALPELKRRLNEHLKREV